MKNKKSIIIYIALIVSLFVMSVATTLALVSDEHSTTDAVIKFDKVSLMGDTQDGNGSRLSLTLDNVTGNGEVVFDKGLNPKHYLMIKPTNDTAPCYIRFKIYFSLETEELNEEHLEELEYLNAPEFIYNGFELNNNEHYAFKQSEDWIYLVTPEENSNLLKVVTKEDNATGYILSEKYILNVDSEAEGKIAELSSKYSILLKVEVEAIQTFNLKGVIDEMDQNIEESENILNSSNGANDAQTLYGGATIQDYVQASTDNEDAKEDKPITPDILDAQFIEGGLYDYTTETYLTKYGGNVSLKSDNSINRYACTFTASNKAYYKDDDFKNYYGKVKKSFTFECLVKFNSNPTSTLTIPCGNTNGGGVSLCRQTDSNGNTFFLIRFEKDADYTRLYTNCQTGRYYHLVLTFDGKSVKLYKDGALVDIEENINSSIKFTEDLAAQWFAIGSDTTSNNGEFFINATVSYVKLYSKVLPQEDVINHSMEDLKADIIDASFNATTCVNNAGTGGLSKLGSSTIFFDESIGMYACRFNGSGAYKFANFSSYYSTVTGGFTMEILVKVVSNRDANNLFSNNQTGGICMYSYGQYISGNAHNGSNYVAVGSNKRYSDVYVHAFFNYDGYRLRMYCNGELHNSVATSKVVMTSYSSSKWLAIGADTGGSSYELASYSTIAFAKIYSRPLSLEQIQKLNLITEE